MQHVDNLDFSFLIKPNDKILLAFSGGPDSVFLVKKLLMLKSKMDIEFAICYINHMLREEAFEEENWVLEFAKKNNLKCYIRRVNVLNFSKRKKISIETAGRILRYRILKKIAMRNNYNKIATAHHLNDALETFILNSIRGSGIFGLVLKPKYKNIIRPIILYSKEEILANLNENEYLVDKTNFENIYSRNFIRNEILAKIKEKFENYLKGFKNTYLNLLEMVRIYEREMKVIYKKAIIYKDRNIKIFRRDVFLKLEEQNIKLFFSKLIREPSRMHLNYILKAIKDEGKLNLAKNYFFEVRGNFIGIYKRPLKFDYLIYIYPKPSIIYINEYKMKIIVEISQKPILENFTLNFNLYKIFSPIIIRKRKKGDRIGNKKLKKILIDYKIPNLLKDFLPIIQKDDNIYIPLKPYVEEAKLYLVIRFESDLLKEAFRIK